MASTIHAGVKTSPWSATRFFDLLWLMGECFGSSTRGFGATS